MKFLPCAVLLMLILIACKPEPVSDGENNRAQAGASLSAGSDNPDQGSSSAQTTPLSELQLRYALAAATDNLLSTDLTALVEITGVARLNTDQSGSTDAERGAIYTAKVVQIYSGTADDTIHFTLYSTDDIAPPDDSDNVRIVSLCVDADGRFYLPDVGYQLPAAARIKTLLESVTGNPAGIQDSDQGVRGREACE